MWEDLWSWEYTRSSHRSLSLSVNMFLRHNLFTPSGSLVLTKTPLSLCRLALPHPLVGGHLHVIAARVRMLFAMSMEFNSWQLVPHYYIVTTVLLLSPILVFNTHIVIVVPSISCSQVIGNICAGFGMLQYRGYITIPA